MVVNGAATLELAIWALLVALDSRNSVGAICRNTSGQDLRCDPAIARGAVLRGSGVLRGDAVQAVLLGQTGLAARLRAVQRVDRDRIAGVHPQTHIMIVDAILYGDSHLHR